MKHLWIILFFNKVTTNKKGQKNDKSFRNLRKIPMKTSVFNILICTVLDFSELSNLGFVQAAALNHFFGISRLYPYWLEKFWTAKEKTREMRFLQIRSKTHLELVWNVILIGFLQVCLYLDGQIQSVFFVTCNMTERLSQILSARTAPERPSRI